jgi:signal peptidase I
MLGTRRKNVANFSIVEPEDDRDIQIQHVKRETRHGFFADVGYFFRDIIFALALAILFGVFVIQPVAVEGTSMLPQLHDGERLLVNKLIYYKSPYLQQWGFPKIERGDVVVFWFPNDPDKSFVKRVIGLPGETVEVRNGVFYVDGKMLNEPYLDPERNMAHANMSPKKVESHYYFVAGDNRDNSYDSRSWGLVPEKYIYGKAVFRYYPFSDFGFIQHGKLELGGAPSSKPVQLSASDEISR